MSNPHPLSEADRELLGQVQRGDFDSSTAPPARLDRLISIGLVEVNSVITLPILLTRYNVRLTPSGYRALLALS